MANSFFDDTKVALPSGPKSTKDTVPLAMPAALGPATSTMKISYTDPRTGKVNVPLPTKVGLGGPVGIGANKPAIPVVAPQTNSPLSGVRGENSEAAFRFNNAIAGSDFSGFKEMGTAKGLKMLDSSKHMMGKGPKEEANYELPMAARGGLTYAERKGTQYQTALQAARDGIEKKLGYLPTDFDNNQEKYADLGVKASAVNAEDGLRSAQAKEALAKIPLYGAQADAAKTTARAAEIKALMSGQSNQYDSSPGLDPTQMGSEVIKALAMNPDNKQLLALYNQLFPEGRQGGIPWKNKVARHRDSSYPAVGE